MKILKEGERMLSVFAADDRDIEAGFLERPHGGFKGEQLTNTNEAPSFVNLPRGAHPKSLAAGTAFNSMAKSPPSPTPCE